MPYTVTLSEHCACENCAGEMLGEATHEEFATLRAAVEYYEHLRSQIGDRWHDVSEEPDCYPFPEACRWYATADNHDLGCDGNGREVLTLSLPVDTMTPSSLWRVNNLLAKRWRY